MRYLLPFLGGFNMKPIAFVALVVMAGWFAFGMILSDKGLPTFDLSAARAGQIQAQTASQKAKDDQDLKQKIDMDAMTLKRAQESADEQLRHEREINKTSEVQHVHDLERDSALYALAAQVGIGIVALLLLVIGGGVTYYLYAAGQSKILDQKRKLLEMELRREVVAPADPMTNTPYAPPSVVAMPHGGNGRSDKQFAK